EFEKMNLWKMRCAGSNVMYLKVVHYLNIVSVNITKNRVCVVKRNLKLQELKNVNFKEGVRNVNNRKNKRRYEKSKKRERKVEKLTNISREMKQRTDSIKEIQEAGREDLTKKLEDEIKILQAYMPEQLSDEELAEIVKTTISEVNATSKKDFGKVMGQVMPKVKGKTDGSKVQKLVQEYLS